MRENTVPIATLDFEVQNLEEDEVGEICNKIREISDLRVFEDGHNERYTIAIKKE